MNSKFITKKQEKQKTNPFKKYLFLFFNQVLWTIVFVLVLLIGFKMNKDFKVLFNKQVYNQNFPFSSIKNFYQKYFGKDFSFSLLEEKEVFDEKLSYETANLYQDGVRLEVSKNYMVPALESGIVVFVGEKENYGNTVIVQQVNGVDAWYGNIDVDGIKLYDYVSKGKLLGEVRDKTLYLAFQKEGEFQDYKNYLT